MVYPNLYQMPGAQQLANPLAGLPNYFGGLSNLAGGFAEGAKAADQAMLALQAPGVRQDLFTEYMSGQPDINKIYALRAKMGQMDIPEAADSQLGKDLRRAVEDARVIAGTTQAAANNAKEQWQANPSDATLKAWQAASRDADKARENYYTLYNQWASMVGLPTQSGKSAATPPPAQPTSGNADDADDAERMTRLSERLSEFTSIEDLQNDDDYKALSTDDKRKILESYNKLQLARGAEQQRKNDAQIHYQNMADRARGIVNDAVGEFKSTKASFDEIAKQMNNLKAAAEEIKAGNPAAGFNTIRSVNQVFEKGVTREEEFKQMSGGWLGALNQLKSLLKNKNENVTAAENALKLANQVFIEQLKFINELADQKVTRTNEKLKETKLNNYGVTMKKEDLGIYSIQGIDLQTNSRQSTPSTSGATHTGKPQKVGRFTIQVEN